MTTKLNEIVNVPYFAYIQVDEGLDFVVLAKTCSNNKNLKSQQKLEVMNRCLFDIFKA